MQQQDDENFEEPILKLRQEYLSLEGLGPDAEKKRARLDKRIQELQVEVYAKLTPWQETMVARHPQRPYTLDYIKHLCEDFVEWRGDRRFADDPAIVAGTAVYRGRAVVVIGHQKGRNAKERIERNFGMPRPEGYRKALRLMQLAGKFKRPVLCFIDTPGAYPGIEAEERGQAEAIARNILEMSRLRTPIVVTVTGEGGSGGALAVGVGDRVLMLQHSVYSVISPEGCAAILWRDAVKKREAAEALKLTSKDLLALGVIDEIVAEAPGGAHSDVEATLDSVDAAVSRNLLELEKLSIEELLEKRHAKFRAMGRYETLPAR
jgi:acetyl-CoA carboxylase carboxyl transferase subunit alpha